VADDRRGTVGVTATARVTQVPRGIALALQLILTGVSVKGKGIPFVIGKDRVVAVWFMREFVIG
jgi:hypothetical protein